MHGGVDLRLAARAAPSHRRVPSDEALLRMAAQHRAALPPPRASVPLPAPPSHPSLNLNSTAAPPPADAPPKRPLPTALSAPAASPSRRPGSPPKAVPLDASGAADVVARRPLRELGNSAGSGTGVLTMPGVVAAAAGAGTAAADVAGRAVAAAAGRGADGDAERLAAEARAVYGERFSDRAARVQRESPHGRRPGWAVRPVIVKSGDDCRQVLARRNA